IRCLKLVKYHSTQRPDPFTRKISSRTRQSRDPRWQIITDIKSRMVLKFHD
ncbi:hypothetical protein ACJMK2_041488, partial [Sinanodonta woodiana]